MDRIATDPGICWVGVKHYSPACALQVARIIAARRPAAVLVEGPDDATPLVPWLIHADTQPPVTLLSSWVDRRNKLGQNGVLSPAEDVPVRYRGWWPLVAHGPELAAVRAGHEVGAEVCFIDASLKAQLPTLHGVERLASDRDLAESAYVRTLAARAGFSTFAAYWDATFEARGISANPEAFRRAVLTFGWCARHVGSGADDASTLLRERHMRYHVDAARKRHPDGELVVVVGAYHAAELPFVRGRRAPGRPDGQTRTLLCAHSFRALARLAREQPGWGDAVVRASGAEAPLDAAALELLVATARLARDRGAPVGTADAVGALEVARRLARLRGSPQVTPAEILDAVTTAYVKGDLGTVGGPVLAAVREILVGQAVGCVAEGAGRPPLMADFHAQAKRHRLDLSGVQRTVRCDGFKHPHHRRKSAFLHAARLLDVPMFGELPDSGEAYKGPDLATGTRLDLTTETWAVVGSEEIDDRLVALSDRGDTLAQAADGVLREDIEAAGHDVARLARAVLGTAQVRSVEMLTLALDRLLQGAAEDADLAHLVSALEDLVALQGYPDAVPPQGEAKVEAAGHALFVRACLAVPGARHGPPEGAEATVDRLQALVRLAVAGVLHRGQVPPDRALLIARLGDLCRDPTGRALVRGAGFGLLHALGALSDHALGIGLRSYLEGPLDRVLEGGAFLEGVLRVQRSAFLTSDRLLRVVHEALGRLDDVSFRRILPDLRRGFSVFVPAELDAIGAQVWTTVSGAAPGVAAVAPSPDEVAAARRIDARVVELIRPWLA